MIGENEPEAVVNVRDLVRQRGDVYVQITGPLVSIEGSADEATVKRATQKILAELKSVVVEATSSGAPATQKRIRTGATFR